MKKNTNEGPPTFEIGRGATVKEVEELLARLSVESEALSSDSSTLKLATNQSRNILADVWSAIGVGTFCLHARKRSIVKMWGIPKITEPVGQSKFINSLAGLAAVQMASSVVPDSSGDKLNQDHIEHIISYERQGILEQGGGTTRTLCEFDPQQSIARALLGGTSQRNIADRRRMFRHTILQFRSALEIGSRNRGIIATDAGSIKQLTTFLSELHDNAYEHGRADPYNVRKIRFLRLRKHMSTNKEDLARRAYDIPALQTYVENITRDTKSLAIIEASVSDFGMGILDHFLNSQYGNQFASWSRESLLHEILLERLSAKGIDPAAGQGLFKALNAAKQMSAFVSLRTGEFWLGQSYASPDAPLRLRNLGGVQHAHVAGTHWQFIWPQPV